MMIPAHTLVPSLEDLASYTDAPASIGEVLDRFRASLGDSEGEAAVEVGVRAGGTSASMCLLTRDRPGFIVLSVDPWGNAPSIERGGDVSDLLDYGDGHYATARRLLSSFPNSALFRMDADLFLSVVLPVFRWWEAGREYPTRSRWLSFIWLDGPHDDADVAREALLSLPILAPGGRLCIDNADRCPRAIALLEGIRTLRRESMAGTRACFLSGE